MRRAKGRARVHAGNIRRNKKEQTPTEIAIRNLAKQLKSFYTELDEKEAASIASEMRYVEGLTTMNMTVLAALIAFEKTYPDVENSFTDKNLAPFIDVVMTAARAPRRDELVEREGIKATLVRYYMKTRKSKNE